MIAIEKYKKTRTTNIEKYINKLNQSNHVIAHNRLKLYAQFQCLLSFISSILHTKFLHCLCLIFYLHNSIFLLSFFMFLLISMHLIFFYLLYRATNEFPFEFCVFLFAISFSFHFKAFDYGNISSPFTSTNYH